MYIGQDPTTGTIPSWQSTIRLVAGLLSNPDFHPSSRAFAALSTTGLSPLRIFLLACYRPSPARAHSDLLEFIFRWSVRVLMENRGSPATLREHKLVQPIHRATNDWDSRCPEASCCRFGQPLTWTQASGAGSLGAWWGESGRTCNSIGDGISRADVDEK